MVSAHDDEHDLCVAPLRVRNLPMWITAPKFTDVIHIRGLLLVSIVNLELSKVTIVTDVLKLGPF
jgi:hypothetical protein